MNNKKEKMIDLIEFYNVVKQSIDSNGQDTADQLIQKRGWDNKKYNHEVDAIVGPNTTAYEALADANEILSKMEVNSIDMYDILTSAGMIRHHYSHMVSDEPQINISPNFHEKSLNKWLQHLEESLNKYKEYVDKIPDLTIRKVKCYEQIKHDYVSGYGLGDDYFGMNYKNNLKYLGVSAIIEFRTHTYTRKGEEKFSSGWSIVKLPKLVKEKKTGFNILYAYPEKVVLTKPNIITLSDDNDF